MPFGAIPRNERDGEKAKQRREEEKQFFQKLQRHE
jgi:hypothetical protein